MHHTADMHDLKRLNVKGQSLTVIALRLSIILLGSRAGLQLDKLSIHCELYTVFPAMVTHTVYNYHTEVRIL